MKYPSLIYVGAFVIGILALALCPAVEVAAGVLLALAIVHYVLVPNILASADTEARHRAD